MQNVDAYAHHASLSLPSTMASMWNLYCLSVLMTTCIGSFTLITHWNSMRDNIVKALLRIDFIPNGIGLSPGFTISHTSPHADGKKFTEVIPVILSSMPGSAKNTQCSFQTVLFPMQSLSSKLSNLGGAQILSCCPGLVLLPKKAAENI